MGIPLYCMALPGKHIQDRELFKYHTWVMETSQENH